MRGEPLQPHPATLVDMLDAASVRAPDRPFLIERDARGAWHQVTFAGMAERSWRAGAALRALGASRERPVMILSGNGIDHATVMFGALRAGVPVCSVSARAGLNVNDGFARLRAMAGVVRPAVVFARDGAAYAPAVRAALPDAAFVSVSESPPGTRGSDYAAMLAHAPLAAEAVPVGGDTVAKIAFTSGSSGEPKGAVATHGMICAMLQGITQVWPFLYDRPPVMVDWLPWSHCFGGNKVLGIALHHAGTLYVDDGAPVAERFERSVRLRAEIAPTVAFDVPLGWTMWVERLRADDALRRRWLSRLDLACWGGATLPAATRDALRAIGIPLAAGWGCTETSPTVTLTQGVDPPSDAVGVPVAGVELKLVPSGDAYEARVRGPQVTHGYYWRPDLTAAAFDEEGFYRTGDVVRPIDARAPERGLAFVSRTDDRFKLSSGAWVQAAELRDAFLTACGDAADVLVTGDGREDVGLLVWPTAAALLLDRDLLRAQVAAAMRSVTGSAGRPRRALILDEAAHGDERAEKGTLVRRTVLARRAAAVAHLHASEPGADVIVA